MSKRQMNTDDLRVAELKVQLRMAVQAVCAAKELLDQLEASGASPAASSTAMAGVPETDALPPASSEARLIPVTDWPKFHPWPKVGGLRHLIFNASRNGFDRVIRKVGDRVLIHEKAFFEWVENRHLSGEESAVLPTRRSRARRGRG